MSLEGRQVLVTGATGFIGGRLVEELVLAQGATVRCMVRDLRKASRIARFDLDIVQGDFADPRAVDEAVQGSEIVFNLAFDFSEVNKHDGRMNTVGADNLCKSALKHGATLVHVSTGDVYGWPENGTIDESQPRRPDFSAYARSKIAIEDIFLGYQRDRGLRATILQPTLVYGPYSGPWTTTPVKQLREGVVVLVDGGTGTCNLVYVDDVVNAMIAASTNDEAMGKSFLISGADTVTWKQFYSRYEDIIGTKSTISKTTGELRTMIESSNQQNGKSFPANLFMSAAPLREPVKRVPGSVSAVRKLKSLAASPGQRTKSAPASPRPTAARSKPAENDGKVLFPDEARLKLSRSNATVSTERARKILGWEPQYDFVQGMNLTAEFIRWAKLA